MGDFLLKDELFNGETVGELARLVAKNHEGFSEKNFMDAVFDKQWPELELKQRMRHVTLTLHESLQLKYKSVIKILNKVSATYKGFAAIVLPDYVEVFGQDEFDLSVKALERYTKCCSSEFAVRPFIIQQPEKMMSIMQHWTENKNEHVRRLASEGCRPRLPWGVALPGFKKDPAPIIPILEKLKDDRSEYVRKSVANNLNDISKDNPELVLDLAEKWFGDSENTDWIVKHALRTLLKQGNKRAMKLFGFGSADNFKISPVHLTNNKIKIGESIYIEFEIKNISESKLNCRLEYKVHFVKKNGSSSGKVFQISESAIEPGEVKVVRKKHNFSQCTTRTHYPGKHSIDIILNGEKTAETNLNLIE